MIVSQIALCKGFHISLLMVDYYTVSLHHADEDLRLLVPHIDVKKIIH